MVFVIDFHRLQRVHEWGRHRWPTKVDISSGTHFPVCIHESLLFPYKNMWLDLLFGIGTPLLVVPWSHRQTSEFITAIASGPRTRRVLPRRWSRSRIWCTWIDLSSTFCRRRYVHCIVIDFVYVKWLFLWCSTILLNVRLRRSIYHTSWAGRKARALTVKGMMRAGYVMVVLENISTSTNPAMLHLVSHVDRSDRKNCDKKSSICNFVELFSVFL